MVCRTVSVVETCKATAKDSVDTFDKTRTETQIISSLCMVTCGGRFRRALFMKSSIFLRNRRLYIKNYFAL